MRRSLCPRVSFRMRSASLDASTVPSRNSRCLTPPLWYVSPLHRHSRDGCCIQGECTRIPVHRSCCILHSTTFFVEMVRLKKDNTVGCCNAPELPHHGDIFPFHLLLQAPGGWL